MTISAVHRPNISQIRSWLALNWPAALWLLAAVVTYVAGSKSWQVGFDQAANLTDIPEGDRAEMRRALAGLRLSPTFLAWYEAIVFIAASSLIHLTIGWLLIRRAPRSGFACFLAFILLAMSNMNYPPSIDEMLPGQPAAQAIIRVTTVVAISGFFTLPFVFPDGRFVPRWTVIWAIYNTVSVVIFAFFPSLIPDGDGWAMLETVTTVLMVFSIIFSIGYRYRKVSSPDQRRQIRWVMLGLLVGVPGFFLGDYMMRNIDASPAGVACLIGFLTVMPVATSLPTVTLGIAILHHRLFDIDLVLRRTLVWLFMTAAVTGMYIAVVVVIGGLIGSRGSLVLSLIATGIVAVAFQPLRDHVQRGASRLLFGERDDPYAVLARLGRHVEDSLNTADLLPAIVRTTAEMLRLPYAALFLDRGEGPVLVASSGIAGASTFRLPLVYQGETVGALDVAPRTPGEVFGRADRRLLEDLARQVGVAARAVSLAADLQQSRERIVTSREEERRRLRRDLHDGLGSQLAALIMQAGTARMLLRSDPEAADRELADMREELRAAVANIRTLVLGLRPPALDELGLAGAIRARLARLGAEAGEEDGAALLVCFDANDPLPPMSAAVEVAAYRIVEEAVTNVVKHARASCLTVELRNDGRSLLLKVEDDGAGMLPSPEPAGMGLQSMRERATELGGTCAVTTGVDGRGTVIRVALPMTSLERERGGWNGFAS